MNTSCRALDQKLRKAGWFWLKGRGKGSHRNYEHPTRTGTITVPWHQGQDLNEFLFKKILKQAGIEEDDQ